MNYCVQVSVHVSEDTNLPTAPPPTPPSEKKIGAEWHYCHIRSMCYPLSVMQYCGLSSVEAANIVDCSEWMTLKHEMTERRNGRRAEKTPEIPKDGIMEKHGKSGQTRDMSALKFFRICLCPSEVLP